MTEEQRRKNEKRVLILSLVIIGALVAIMVLLGVKHMADTIWFPLVIAVFLFLFWLVSDVASVRWLQLFEGKTEEQKKSYYIYAVINLIGLGGLVYFMIDMQSTTGVIIYVVCTFLKRKFRTDFSGEEESEAAADETAEEAIASDETAEEAIASDETADGTIASNEAADEAIVSDEDNSK